MPSLSPPTTPSSRLRAVRHLIRLEQEQAIRHQVKADINVTPLVDVVLVLLIIFMVVTPLIANGVAVELPRTTHHAKKPDDGKDIVVSITAGERLFLGSRPISGVADLVKEVAAQKHEAAEKTVFVKGDERCPYRRVREIMEALHKSALDDILLGTEEATERR